MIDLATAEAVIRAGGVVVIPTDTVYGLACDPASAEAVDRVYRIKGRPPELELSLLAADQAQLGGLVRIPPGGLALARAFWPGPLSLVCPLAGRRLAIPRRRDDLMVRVPDHMLLRRLLGSSGAVASTSANRHGEPAAHRASEAQQALGTDVDGVLDGGPAAGVASTIIDVTSTPPRVLRDGPIGRDALRPYLLGGEEAASGGHAGGQQGQ